jgi:tRNA(His) 5'-end guanylyltransferase
MHAFEKPNDERALNLMNACATSMLEKFPDIVFAYGVSDEYRYIACSYMKVIVKLFAYFLSKKGMQILMWTLCFEMHRLIMISACLPVCFAALFSERKQNSIRGGKGIRSLLHLVL